MGKWIGYDRHTSTSLHSQASDTLRLTDICILLKSAWKNNEKHGVTGLLLHRKGQFMQYIEGPEQAIARLLTNLKNDARHEHIVVVHDQMVREREFVCWMMGYDRVAYEEEQDLFSYYALFSNSEIP